MTLITKFLVLVLLFLFYKTGISAQPSRQTLLFNDGWKFYKGDVTGSDKSDFNDVDWRTVTLPHDWTIEGPYDEQWASATGYLPGGIGWYRKQFDIAPNLRNKNIFIYFDGVYKNSEVWINGNYLGKRPNGYTPFQYEITKYLNKNGKNTIAVKVDHTEYADSRWYTGSGIYRNVYMVATDPVHIDLWGVQFTTPQVSAAKATARIMVSAVNQSAANVPVIIKATLLDGRGKTIATNQQQIKMGANTNEEVNLNFTVNNPALWSTENPQLYKLQTALLVAGKKVDEVTESVGFRSFRFDKDKGFFLNGKNMKLKGVCLHDDAGALGVSVPAEVWVRRLQRLKEGGCNSVRMSHNPHADYLYSLMDSMGFLVMDEAFDEWELGKNKWIKGWNVGTPGKDGYHSDFKAWADKDVRDMVLRNINHPSIFMWSIGNEIDYPNDPYTHEVLSTGRNPQIYGRGYTAGFPAAARLGELARQLVAVVKKYDTSRVVTSALAGVVMSNETTYPEELDIVGYNYQEYRYPDDHTKYPARIIYGSENGHGLAAWNAVADNDYISGQYLWTGIDYLGEARTWPSKANGAGLLDLAGNPKSEFYFRQSLWSEKPMLFVGTVAMQGGNGAGGGGRRNLLSNWNYKAGDSVRINCYTNDDEAELFLNGTSLGRKKMSDAKDTRILSWQTVFQPGELVVKGYKAGKEINQQTIKTADEAYVLKAVADKPTLNRNKQELAHIEIEAFDKNGNPVYGAGNEVTISIAGPAILLGLENSDLSSHEDYKATKRKLYNGKLLAYIQAQNKPGTITVKISSPGLQDAMVTLK